MLTKRFGRKIFLTIIVMVAVLPFFLHSCDHDDDSGEGRRESVTRKITSDINPDSLEKYVAWLSNLGTRFALADNRREIAGALGDRFTAIGLEGVHLDSFMIDRYYNDKRYQQWQYNVVASISGSLYPDSVCLLGAHYDDNLRSGDPFIAAPGANDNASGIAAILEIARVLKKNNFVPERTIRFVAFGAEELGLYGSTDYAAKALENSESISMMLNNDMIAYEPTTDPSGWKVDIMDYDNSGGLRAEAEKMCEKFTSLGFVNDNTYSHQSDSYPFSLNGYRALFFFAFTFDPDYHSMNDLPEHCNFEYCSEVVRVSCAMLVYNN